MTPKREAEILAENERLALQVEFLDEALHAKLDAHQDLGACIAEGDLRETAAVALCPTCLRPIATIYAGGATSDPVDGDKSQVIRNYVAGRILANSDNAISYAQSLAQQNEMLREELQQVRFETARPRGLRAFLARFLRP